MALQTLALFFLGTVAAGGIAWVFIYPILSGERKAEKRKELVAKPEQVTVTRVAAQQRGTQKARREQVEDTLKELEVRQKNAKRRPANSLIATRSWPSARHADSMRSQFMGERVDDERV